jgi:tripartite-type tricarboxylate transporter receptor subunit TctC
LAEHPELKGYDVSGWFALMAPKGLPEAVAERLRATLKGVLKDPQFRQVLEGMGGQVAADAEDLPGLMQQETAHYKKWFETANLNAK